MKTSLITLIMLALPFGLYAEPIKALLITGGCCHDYDAQREIIPAAVDFYSKLPVEWTIYHQRTKAGDRPWALGPWAHRGVWGAVSPVLASAAAMLAAAEASCPRRTLLLR